MISDKTNQYIFLVRSLQSRYFGKEVEIFGTVLRPHHWGLAAEKLLRISIVVKYPGLYIIILLTFVTKKKVITDF
jgi:hypothetical protein